MLNSPALRRNRWPETMDRQELKHVCKFCSKSFACGRSLGGHMRSHMVNDVSSHADGTKLTKKKLPPLSAYLLSQPKKTAVADETAAYVLREKPRRSWKFSDNGGHIDKTCKDCGKVLMSWKALLNHMKSQCCGEEEGEDDEKKVENLVMDSQSDNEGAAPSKKKRSKRRRTRYIIPANSSSLSLANNPSSSSVSIPDNEQEEVALCLIMLSRDVSHSPEKTTQKEEEHEDTPDDCDHMKKMKIASFDDGKFECTTCSKVFHSYQALGGHRASHKKIKGCFASKIDSSENSIETESSHDQIESEEKKAKGHECPICSKVFPSGQALGGHKRAHLVDQGKANASEAEESAPVIRNLLDLNLPAPEEDEEADAGFTPWWLGNAQKCVGLISN